LAFSAAVDPTVARNTQHRIAIGVSDLRTLTASACARRSRGLESATPRAESPRRVGPCKAARQDPVIIQKGGGVARAKAGYSFRPRAWLNGRRKDTASERRAAGSGGTRGREP
jgi:hypothetical protein